MLPTVYAISERIAALPDMQSDVNLIVSAAEAFSLRKIFGEASLLKPKLNSPITAFVSVFATAEYSDCPSFARFEMCQDFIDRLYRARLMLGNGIRMIVLDDSPLWDNEEEYHLQFDTLNVCDSYFYFNAHPKHCDYDIETTVIYFDHLQATVADAISRGEGECYFHVSKEQVVALVE